MPPISELRLARARLRPAKFVVLNACPAGTFAGGSCNRACGLSDAGLEIAGRPTEK
jgi:hypothetical protein